MDSFFFGRFLFRRTEGGKDWALEGRVAVSIGSKCKLEEELEKVELQRSQNGREFFSCTIHSMYQQHPATFCTLKNARRS